MSDSSPISVAFSAKTLRTLPQNVYENDFTFIVGEARYQCPSFVASLLSPRLCRLQAADPTIHEIEIQTPDPGCYFESIVNLDFDSRLRSPAGRSFVRRLCAELLNRELYAGLIGDRADELTISNALDRAEFEFGFGLGGDCASALDFCLSHFAELDRGRLSSLPIELFSAMICGNTLRLEDEDMLYEIIHDRICVNSQNSSLLEFVRIENLTRASLESFISLICESFDFLTLSVWRSVCVRLSSPASSGAVECGYSAAWPLAGIISHLSTKCGGHVMDRDVVSITASSTAHPNCPLRNVADFSNQTYFYAKNERNSWICYNFKAMRVNLTHYSIRSARNIDGYHLQGWHLDGSVDGRSWVELDRRENNRSLNGRGAVATFSISGRNEDSFQMIRFQQHGPNSSSSHALVVSAIEFFGKLMEPRE
jgi:hypothetical protein